MEELKFLYNENVEMSIVGALMENPQFINTYSVKPEYFFMEKFRTIYEKMLELQNKGIEIDFTNLSCEIDEDDVNTFENGLMKILQHSPYSALNLNYHCKVLRELYLARVLQRSLLSVYDTLMEKKCISEPLEELERSLSIISSDDIDEGSDMSDAVISTLALMDSFRNNAGFVIKTGFPTLDMVLNGGFKYPELIVIGGRPSMGKSAFAIHFAKTAALNGKNVVFVSIEMTKEQIVTRMMCEAAGVTREMLYRGEVLPPDGERWILQMQQLPILILDTPSCRELGNIKRVARKLKRNNKIDLLVIDYLQLIKTGMKFGTRDLEIGYITGELKSLAKELKVPVILLAQVSRPAKGEKVKEPVLSDLRESGNIEQDADVVIFPHRPTYYDASLNEWDNKGVLVVAKNREGERNCNVYFEHDDKFKRIWECGAVDQPLGKQKLPITKQEANDLF